ncbi:hypothetical protein SAMD00024442_5_63 [Candidatus Symbiothrix dinenymphae]|nr:hypothetical protein SAMD00024442_5_63 [Candidatus Symbiothrix dinenymphae]
MKKNICKNRFTAFIIAAMCILPSCADYLDIVPDNVATMEMAFSTRINAERFLFTCYGYVPQAGDLLANPALATGDEVWNAAERTFLYSNTAAIPIAMGNQNTNDPYMNYWSGGSDGRGGTNLFTALRDCNIFLENAHLIPDIEESERTRWIAEVKVLKAYFHYFLMQLYGPIPIIKENISTAASPDEVKIVREPVDKVVEYIVALIDEATADKEVAYPALPISILVRATELGRLTLPAALAIKAKVLTLAASPLFNGNPDFASYKNAEGVNLINPVENPAKWETARDALKEAIEYAHKGGHQLYTFDERISFTPSDTTFLELTLRNTITARFNNELIWGIGNNGTTNMQQVCSPVLTTFQLARQIGMHNPTLNVVEQFYSNNGVPIEEDNTYDYDNRYQVDAAPVDHFYYITPGLRTASLNFYREPRFYAYLGFDNGKWFNLEAANDQNSLVVHNKAGETGGRSENYYNITGYYAKKLVNYKLVLSATTNTSGSVGYPFPIIRLADLYLLYAEALNECKSAPDADVYQYIQLVRDKAGLDEGTGGLVQTWATHSTNSLKPTTKTGMRDIIHRERLIELAFEGQRFYDLRRWRLSSEYLNKPIRGWNVAGLTEADYYQETYLYFRKFTPKDYFWPIKTSDMYVNNKLIQSPYWD